MTTDPKDVRTSPGRTLTWGMLDQSGKAIVIGAYEARPFPIESVTREAVKMLTAKGLLSARARRRCRPSSTT